MLYLNRCPADLIDYDIISLWDDYQTFEVTGHFPYLGGFKDQPNIFIETVKFCKSLINKITDDPFYKRARYNIEKARTELADKTEAPNLGKLLERRRHAKKKV